MEHALLQLENVSAGYQEPLITGITAQLSAGDICLMIGNNGVGKTTLIRTLLKQLAPMKGEITLAGRPLSSLSTTEIAKTTAVVFSKAPIPANMTVRDLVSLGKFIHYPFYFQLNTQDKQEVNDIIDWLGLTHLADKPLHQLSDGNLQKAYIGRALAQDAPLIILDEPTTHLDENNKIMLLQLLRQLAKEQNKCILFSSHDWRLAREFSDKVWLLQDGSFSAGNTEHILYEHKEMLNATVFNLNQFFKEPTIRAPQLEAQLLYSFLQKNCNTDLSSFNVTFQDDQWIVANHHDIQQFKNFQAVTEYFYKIK